MIIDTLKINIIDTQTNTLIDIDESAGYDSLHLIYNGKEDLFQNIMTSELHFSILVKDAADGKFAHLFTGDEFRYKIQLQDITDPLVPILIWEGHLLVEQYNEPWQLEAFFVEYVATDGIGLTKNKYLPDTFYVDVKPVSQILAECLKTTGNSFAIKIAPAIENALKTLTYYDIAINTASYIDGTKKLTAYDILNNILTAIGCKLLQQDGVWFIVGINRLNDLILSTQNYDSDGLYIDTTNYARNNIVSQFNGPAQLHKLPPLKTVEVTFKPEYQKNVFASDLMLQPPIDNADPIDAIPVRYWQKNGVATYNLYLASSTTAANYDYSGVTIYDPLSYYYGPAILVSPNVTLTGEPFNVALSGYITSGQVAANFIDLINPVYLTGNFETETYFNFKLVLKAWMTTGTSKATVDSALDAGTYDGVFLYEVLQEATTLFSNKTSFTNYALFNFSLESFEDKHGVAVIATINIEKVPITQPGYINIKLHPPVGDVATTYIDHVVVSDFDCNLTTPSDKVITKTRNINYTTKEEIEVFHSDDITDLTEKQFLINPNYVFTNIILNIAALDTLLVTSNYTTLIFGIYTHYQFNLDTASFNLIKSNGDLLYKKQNSDGAFVKIDTYYLSEATANPLLIDIWTPSVAALDTLYIRFAADTSTVTDVRYIRDKWKRYGQTETISYVEALARVFNDVKPNALIMVSAKLFKINKPLDIIEFFYIDPKNFVITSLDIELKQAITSVTMIEGQNQIITDYV